MIGNSLSTRSLIINTRGKCFSKITLFVRWLRNTKLQYQFQFKEDRGRVSERFLQRRTKIHKLARKKGRRHAANTERAGGLFANAEVRQRASIFPKLVKLSAFLENHY